MSCARLQPSVGGDEAAERESLIAGLYADDREETGSATDSLEQFVRASWHIVAPGRELVWNWHLTLICRKLEAVTRGEVLRLIINVPPRSTKSTIVSVLWPAWVWVHDTSAQFLTGSHNASLAVRDALLTRRLIDSEWFRLRWPGVVFESDQNQKTRYDLAGGGHRITFGMKAGVTGEGGDFLVIDDPHSAKDAMFSEAEREAVKRSFDGELFTRLNDQSKSAIVIIMQRLHEDDLCGHLLRRDECWDHVCLPMEYDPARGHTEDERTEPGELLDQRRFPAEWVAQAKTTLGAYAYAGQMQQEPAPDGGGVLRGWRYYQAPPDAFDLVIESWDLTFDETAKGSYVVGQLWGSVGPDRYLLDQFRKRVDVVGELDAIADMTERARARGLSVSAVVIENKASGAPVIRLLRDKVGGLVPWPPKGERMGSKEARAGAAAPSVEAGNYYLPDPALHPWVNDFVHEAQMFPRGANDDQVDAFAQAHDYLSRNGALMFS